MSIGLHSTELNFEVIYEIPSSGQNSTALYVKDLQLDAYLFVKKISKKDFKEKNPDYFREAKILYASSHPYIVSVYYSCEDNDHIYIAMPFYENGSIGTLIEKRFLTIREVLRYSIHFLTGLNNIHMKGLIHFDVKPDNIMLSNSNEALLSDFGLSMRMDKDGNVANEIFYIPHLPPESLTSTIKNAQTDIYLAGLTIYRMLNGNDHFLEQYSHYENNDEEYKKAVVNSLFPNRRSYLWHVPQKLQKIVNRAMEVDLAKRYQNILTLINEISTIDTMLDWRFERRERGEVWTNVVKGVKYEVCLYRTENNLYNIDTMKTNEGNTRLIKKLCLSNLDYKGAETNVKTILLECEK